MRSKAPARSSLSAFSLWLGLLGAVTLRADAQQVIAVSSGERGVHHVEPHMASNPRNSREIVIAAMRVRSTELATWEVVVFRSDDGGQHWHPVALPPKGSVRCGGDPWVVWGRGQSVYVACLAPVPTPDGNDFHLEVFLHRSRDAGRTWAAPLQVPVDRVGEWDHPVLVRAPTQSDTAGDVLWVVGTRPRRSGNEFGAVRYVDNGERFGDMRVYRPPSPGNHNFGSAAALDAERLVFTYFTMNPNPPRPFYAVRSSLDGFRSTTLRESVTPWGFPMLSSWRGSVGAGRTLGAVWLEGSQAAGLDVVFARSDDEGTSWRSPVVVTSEQPRVFRTRPNMAADGQGALAITWFESVSGSPCGDVRVRIVHESEGGGIDDVRLARGSAACPTEPPLSAIVERWRGGGDYAGIQGVAPGVFDLVWADVRDDGHQVRFARVRAAARPGGR